jgi:hypothetical protein
MIANFVRKIKHQHLKTKSSDDSKNPVSDPDRRKVDFCPPGKKMQNRME